MKKRLTLALAAGGLMVATLPGVASAGAPLAEWVVTCTARLGGTRPFEGAGPISDLAAFIDVVRADELCTTGPITVEVNLVGKDLG